jgi:AraC-like DNA-binding protein
MIARHVWLIQYRIEEARQRAAGRGQLLRQAAACVGLALLRLIGVRHA